jgi:DNA helicase INO80
VCRGLGKTIQAVAFLCYLSELRNIWGPFLVICPNSTLHQWKNELTCFAPHFTVLPYWGSSNDRQAIRSVAFNSNSNLYTRQSNFHILVTSYTIAVSDVRYLNRIRWQYCIFDEAQALKNSSTQRWNVLLSYKCRSRLLLSGTPVQNQMSELWALLHFIMPEFFDNPKEFAEWQAKQHIIAIHRVVWRAAAANFSLCLVVFQVL